MKITIDKHYTTLAQLPKVKQDIAEFKSRYTEEDIASVIHDAFEETSGAEILKLEIESYPRGYYTDETSFAVHGWLECWSEVFEVRLYLGLDLDVHLIGDIYRYKRV